ncbi:MAG: NAD(+)/NADH kinase [Anaerolineales bacterium]|nr:NAD(+)/NADH kinase [Anaerolineales bacterium]
MPASQKNFANIVVAAHPQVEAALEEAKKLATFLQAHGCQAMSGSLYDDALRYRVKVRQTDLLIALGGDGTMLRAGHLCAPHKVPILGINMGRFGFLMEIRSHEWHNAIPKLLAGEYWVEPRMMLNAEQWRGDEKLGSWLVLNEVVVSRGQIVRPVHLDAYVDQRFLSTYVADGLIASTPTGSTAYALAVGGPILPPELRNILLVPIAPHLSIDRAIVLAEGAAVSIVVHTDHQAVLSVDGQIPVEMADGDRVMVTASDHTVEFIRIQDPDYFYRNLTPHMNQNPALGSRR